MYRVKNNSILKHWDFFLLDLICMILCYMLVRFAMGNSLQVFYEDMYQLEGFALVFTSVLVSLAFRPYKNILRRSNYKEIFKVIQYFLIIVIVNIFYLYLVHQTHYFSRLLMGFTGILFVIVDSICRILLKRSVRKRILSKPGDLSAIVITTTDRYEKWLKDIRKATFKSYKINAIFLMDLDQYKIKTDDDTAYFGCRTDIVDFICHEWVDEVFIDLSSQYELDNSIIENISTMGITTHFTLEMYKHTEGNDLEVETFGNEYIITSSMKFVSIQQMFYKRVIDVIGGIIGCILTGILCIFIAPAIYIKSPGPIFFSQTRIGLNGKKFKIYKFRSMYLDAEERKKELQKKNKLDTNLFFKVDDDPRIIGSEKKDKNGNPKGIGNFIRKTSIDEFPQFWNVLKGDMSLVGTRPPTVDEWEHYSIEHRARMSIKPGITGLWQVSGRSEITDFDEIVALDTEYIKNWSIGEDFKILFKTVGVVLRHEGAE